MECRNAKALIPSYIDGELSEAQAGPLRKHLLDCQSCRTDAQGEKNFKRWFVRDESFQIPAGFSARVARRAFAGVRSEGWSEALRSDRGVVEKDLLRFVLQVTSIAAVLLVVLSIGIRNSSLPSGSKLMADDHPEVSLELALEELDELDRAEAGSAAAVREPARDRAGAPFAETEQ
jgi:anti-sigma factor RsiW